jgi:hypothetical protein
MVRRRRRPERWHDSHGQDPNDAENRVVDIFDEVEEDLRAERAERLMKRYGWLMILAAVLIVGAAAGYEAWTRWQARQDAAVAARYVSAMNAVEAAPAADPAARTALIGPLAQIAETAPEGYLTLARLRAAGLMADAGDLQSAVAMWNSVSADAKADPLLRDLASLLVTQHQLDSGDPAQLAARLEPLAVPGNAWAALAKEQLAILDLRLGKTDEAKAKLHALSIDIGAPAGARARAGALLAGLG